MRHIPTLEEEYADPTNSHIRARGKDTGYNSTHIENGAVKEPNNMLNWKECACGILALVRPEEAGTNLEQDLVAMSMSVEFVVRRGRHTRYGCVRGNLRV